MGFQALIITYSAEVYATTGDNVTIRHLIDNGICTVYDPEIFYLSSGPVLLDSRTNVSVVTNLGPGTHTIKPCLRANDISGGGGTFGSLGYRCMTVECTAWLGELLW